MFAEPDIYLNFSFACRVVVTIPVELRVRDKLNVTLRLCVYIF